MCPPRPSQTRRTPGRETGGDVPRPSTMRRASESESVVPKIATSGSKVSGNGPATSRVTATGKGPVSSKKSSIGSARGVISTGRTSARREVVSSPSPESKLPSKNPPPQAPRSVVRRPQAELGLTVDLTFHFSAKHAPRKGDITIKGSKAFRDAPPKDHLRVFEHKVRECSKLCDFGYATRDEKAKLTKSQLLKHLIECFSLQNVVKVLTPEAIRAMFEMIHTNLYRRLPVAPPGPLDACDSVFDAGWPHLSLVYELLQSAVTMPRAHEYLDSHLLYVLIGNGISLDVNERQAVKDVLVNIYLRFVGLRVRLRLFLGSTFAMGDCSAELLQFFIQCTNGFNAPLKKEHITLFRESILPLHCHPFLHLFSDRLNESISRLVEKQPSFVLETLEYMDKHWPQGGRQKQMCLMRETEYLFRHHGKEIGREHVMPAFRIIGRALCDECSEVCDFAMAFITEDDVIPVMMKHAAIVYPIIWENICRAAKSHWDDTIRINASVAFQGLHEMAPDVYKKVNEERLTLKKARTAQNVEIRKEWANLEDAAKKIDSSLKLISSGAACLA